MTKLLTTVAAALLMFTSQMAAADCDYRNRTPLKMLSAGFEAWKAVSEAMQECGRFDAELDQEFRKKQPAAFAAKPSLYHLGGVSNGTITPLLNAGTIRPLDDLVAEYGKHLSPNQLIRIDGQIMAIAMMVNTQHLMYRQDILDKLNIPVPQTWDEVLAAAEKIKRARVVDYPLGATMKAGWNLAQDFNNLFLGYGGSFFDANNKATLNNIAGVRALRMMKRISQYLDPEYLVSDSTFVQQQFQQGKIAMANLWASRAAAMDDPNESQVVGKVRGASAPRVLAGGAPATTLWWDGIVIAKNISDKEARAAFQVAMEGLDSEMVRANNDAAIWLIEGFEPGAAAEGAIATASTSPAPASYPSSSAMGLMHTALSNELADYLTGNQSLVATLKGVEKAYTIAATEAGLIQ